MEGARPLADANEPQPSEPGEVRGDGHRPTLTAVPGGAAPDDPGPAAAEEGAEPGESAGPGHSVAFREIERRASEEIHRLAAETLRELANLRSELGPALVVEASADRAADVASDREGRTRTSDGVLALARRVLDGPRPLTSASSGAHQPPEVADAARDGARRGPRAWLLAVIAVLIVGLAAGSALYYGTKQPKIYGAQAEFLLTPRFELSDTAVERATENQLLVVTSDSVLKPLASASGIPLATLRQEVSADIEGRSTVLAITVADPDRDRGYLIARLVANKYSQVAPLLAGSSADTRPLDVKTLTPATTLDAPLEPRPMNDLAAGLLVGLVAAAAVVLLLRRPWRSRPYWT